LLPVLVLVRVLVRVLVLVLVLLLLSRAAWRLATIHHTGLWSAR